MRDSRPFVRSSFDVYLIEINECERRKIHKLREAVILNCMLTPVYEIC